MMINPEFVPPGHSRAHRFMLRLAYECQGMKADLIIWALLNMLVNVLRYTHKDRRSAEADFDELTGKTKALLMSHYNFAGQRKEVIVPPVAGLNG